jgi:hypothetical protein
MLSYIFLLYSILKKNFLKKKKIKKANRGHVIRIAQPQPKFKFKKAYKHMLFLYIYEHLKNTFKVYFEVFFSLSSLNKNKNRY